MKLHLIAKVNKTVDSRVYDARKKLKELVKEDQAERNEYRELLKKMEWSKAIEQWCKKKNRSKDDVFDDAKRLKEAKELILKNKNSINPNNVWLLVQHSDEDPKFQKWFLNFYSKPERKNKLKKKWAKYLEDRWLVNTGQPQKNNTQNVEETMENIRQGN